MEILVNEALQRWHQYVLDPSDQLLNTLLDEHAVFYSPVVFKPQIGKPLAFLYLKAATELFSNSGFSYAKEIFQGKECALEFNCQIDDIQINGIDLISFSNSGQIVEFKVMIRPLKAIHLLHSKMKKVIESMMA